VTMSGFSRTRTVFKLVFDDPDLNGLVVKVRKGSIRDHLDWDTATAQNSGNGQVELFGAVSQPFKKSDIDHIVRDIPGVTSVSDQIKVLPLSDFDNRLRVQVARAIFSDPSLSRYAMQPISPIHIIVENGHVTLTGVVSTDSEKNLAGIRANGAGLSFGMVTNNLQVEHPGHKG